MGQMVSGRTSTATVARKGFVFLIIAKHSTALGLIFRKQRVPDR